MSANRATSSASSWEYMSALGISMLLTNLGIIGFDLLVVGVLSNANTSFALYYGLFPLTYSIAPCLVWIIVYSLHSRINVRRAMLWVWILGIGSVAAAGNRHLVRLEATRTDLPDFLTLFILFGAVLFVVMFRTYFRGQPARWR